MDKDQDIIVYRDVEDLIRECKSRLPWAVHTRSSGYTTTVRGPSYAWCEENFGPESATDIPGRPYVYHLKNEARWVVLGGVFHFRDPDEAAAFKICWGGA